MTPTKHITVGVAGHVDHGKTALVRALTGIETDRLKEEQERGMSIVLGFAHLAVPGGSVDLIDVPGHEKFIRTMISGATGVDVALLVIAANECVKPQTVEHLALMELLGIRHGLVAVAKSDLVMGEDRALAVEEIRGFLAGTFLRDAPMCFTSSVTGEGLDALREALAALAAEMPERMEGPFFTIPADRVFTQTGYGVVVTGTLRHGTLRRGQSVEIWPGGLHAEVRGLEVHGQSVEAARPGWRMAANLRGLKKDDLERGDLLATPGALRLTRLLDVDLTLLASAKPLKRGQAVQLFSGADETPARVYPLGRETIVPGETSLAQIRLTGNIAIPVGEPFIIRAASPAETLGGGRVVDPYPQKHTRADEAALTAVNVLAYGTPAEKLAVKLREAGSAGRDWGQLTRDFGLTREPDDVLMVRCAGGLAIHPDIFTTLRAQAWEQISQFHVLSPLRRGMPQEELRRKLPRDLQPAAFARLLKSLADDGTLEMGDGLARRAGYDLEAALSPIEREIRREIEAQFHQGGLKPPGLEETLGKDRRRRNLYYFLVETGTLVPATERTGNRSVTFHREAIADAAQRLQRALSGGSGLTVSELNALLGMTRKFSIPLLEYCDEMGITRRNGDLRFWNGEKEPVSDE